MIDSVRQISKADQGKGIDLDLTLTGSDLQWNIDLNWCCDAGHVTKTKHGLLINPRSTFPLTLISKSFVRAHGLQDLLQNVRRKGIGQSLLDVSNYMQAYKLKFVELNELVKWSRTADPSEYSCSDAMSYLSERDSEFNNKGWILYALLTIQAFDTGLATYESMFAGPVTAVHRWLFLNRIRNKTCKTCVATAGRVFHPSEVGCFPRVPGCHQAPSPALDDLRPLVICPTKSDA